MPYAARPWARKTAFEIPILSQAERRVLIRALTAGRDAARAQRVVDESLAGRLAPNLAVWLPGAVAEVPALQPMAYDFVLEHWAALA